MEGSKMNFIRSLVALVLIAALQLPVVVKISHALYEHIDVECDDFITVHLHEVEFDCDYQKFHFTTNCILAEYIPLETKFLIIQKRGFSFYSFLSKYQKLHFSLRGPPAIS